MASIRKDALGKVGTHTVGQVNSWNMETFINGAIVGEDGGVDNFRLVQLYYEDGEAKCKYPVAGASAMDLFVTVTPEERLEGELLCNFYNGKGERATLAYLPLGFTFETNAINAEGLVEGDKVVSAGEGKFKKAEEGDLTAAAKVFQVSAIELDPMYSIDSQELVQLTVIQ